MIERISPQNQIYKTKELKNKNVSAPKVVHKQEQKPASDIPFGSWSIFSNPNTPTKSEDKKMYKELLKHVDRTGQKNLEILFKTGKLLSRDSDDKSSTLENLYKIIKTPRVQGLNPQTIITETLQTLANPFVITQNFGKIPDFMMPEILSNERFNVITKGAKLNSKLADHFSNTQITAPSAAINANDMNVVSSGSCVAASIEFNLADKKPAEFARYIESLTGPDMNVKIDMKYKDIAPNMVEALTLLDQFNVEHKAKDWENIEVTIRPDKNAIIRANVQNTNKQPNERSSIDVLMQSTFMQLGSESTYNSLTDKRYGEFNPNEKGLTEFEKNFAETIVDNDGGKTSVTYQIVDEDAHLTGYNIDFETVKKHLLDSLQGGSNVIIGITEVDQSNKIIGGHEITVIGTRTDTNGELYFICNDTDDDFTGAIEIKASDLIPKIHHAGIPNKILDMPQYEDTGFMMLKDYLALKQAA